MAFTHMDELWITGDLRPKPRVGDQPIKVPGDDWQEEILLVFGPVPTSGDINYHFSGYGPVEKYWTEVWNFIVARHPHMVEQEDFPEDWATDAAHEADMEILRSIYSWQRRLGQRRK